MDKKQEKVIKKIEQYWSKILDELCSYYGFNREDENLRKTPYRIAKALVTEKCVGMSKDIVTKCRELLSVEFPSTVRVEKSSDSNDKMTTRDQIIVTTNPQITYGICPHHFENVEYSVWTAYVPREERYIGLSKFSRVVDLFVKQPLLQESLTVGLADLFEETLKPKGVMILIKGRHDCMIVRGVKGNKDQYIVTSCARGAFEDLSIKDEFFKLISR